MDQSKTYRRPNFRLMAIKVQLDGLDNLTLFYILLHVLYRKVRSNMAMKRRKTWLYVIVAMALMTVGVLYALFSNNANAALFLGIWIGIALSVLVAIILLEY